MNVRFPRPTELRSVTSRGDEIVSHVYDAHLKRCLEARRALVDEANAEAPALPAARPGRRPLTV